MAARFQEAEFAADLSTVARGEGAETYRDPREFFRITYMTGGLRKVLQSAIERLAGKGGDPVIGLQTSFGGGKTHTMLALYHLASAKNPETLPGLADIFKDAGVATLPMRSKPVVFVGTAAGANQPFTIEGARTVKSLWGLIAVKLGGWKAYETIKASDEARTNPGSEAMIAILKQAAPCLILLDEVVAYARNLEGIPYDGFVSFLQSLTEAANAVPGVLVVGSLPESGAEVGNQRGREALLALEKVFGRVQSAWAPAQGTETFEIIRRRLFQELDPEGEKAREQAVKAFTSYYKNNAGEFPERRARPGLRGAADRRISGAPRAVPDVAGRLGRARKVSEDARRAQDDGADRLPALARRPRCADDPARRRAADRRQGAHQRARAARDRLRCGDLQGGCRRSLEARADRGAVSVRSARTRP